MLQLPLPIFQGEGVVSADDRGRWVFKHCGMLPNSRIIKKTMGTNFKMSKSCSADRLLHLQGMRHVSERPLHMLPTWTSLTSNIRNVREGAT